jgi:hypothetical protein
MAALVTAVCATALAVPAYAQTGGDKATAEQLFSQGRRLMSEERFDVACPMLAESHRIDPGGGTLLNLALCHESQGKLATAWGEFREALALARADRRDDRIRFAEEHVAALEPRLSYLELDVAALPVDAVVALDDSEFGRATWTVALPIDPGNHQLSVRASGHAPWQRAVVIGGEGVTVRVAVPSLVAQAPPLVAQAPPLAQPVAPPPPTLDAPSDDVNAQAVAGWIVSGVGALSIGVGAVFGGLALSNDSDADAVCSAAECPPTDAGREALAQSESAAGQATAANVFIGVGSALVAAGIVIVLTAGSSSTEQAAVRIVPSAWGADHGVTLHTVW